MRKVWSGDACILGTSGEMMFASTTPTETAHMVGRRRSSEDFRKCTLFDEWLPGEYQKCEKCLEATKR